MRPFLVAICLLHAGCEGCDFSFGPVPVVVSVVPADRVGQVTVCAEDQGCQSQTFPASDTGIASSGTPVPPGSVRFGVGWHGYAVCKHPELEVTVEADGCAPETVRRERQRADSDEVVEIEVRLACDAGR